MKLLSNKFLLVCSVIFALLLTAGCSDNSTSVEDEDPPLLPSTIRPVTVDVSYFNNQDVPLNEDHETYHTVKNIAVSGSAAMDAAGLAGIADSFILFLRSQNIQPDRENGSWVWSITVPAGFMKDYGAVSNQMSNNVTIRIFATPAANGMNWEIRFTGSIEDVDLDDFRLISGFTSSDGTNGEWNFYIPESGNTPVISYTWQKSSDTLYEMNIVAIENANQFSINYERDGAEHWMVFNDGSDVASIYWNETTHSGWVESDGVRCSYENFVNTGCS